MIHLQEDVSRKEQGTYNTGKKEIPQETMKVDCVSTALSQAQKTTGSVVAESKGF